jgi:lysophospholipase L1-like esterase
MSRILLNRQFIWSFINMSKKFINSIIILITINFFIVLAGIYFFHKKGGIIHIFQTIKNEQKMTEYYAHYQNRYTLFKNLPHSKHSIFFIGDDLIKEAEWSEMFQDLRIKNRGMSKDTLMGVLFRLDEIIDAQPEKIFIMIGLFDFLKQAPFKEMLIQYETLFKNIQTGTPNTIIYVQSLLPVNRFLGAAILGNTLKKIDNKHIKKFNIKLHTLAEQFDVNYIDLYPHFEKNGQLNQHYTLDGLHLNGAGYFVWKQIITPYLVNN